MAKRIFTMLCAVMLILSMVVIPAQAAETLDLTKMQIVLPQNATAVEATTSLELKDYIARMTGVTLTTVNEGENSGAGIYIGNTKYAAANGITYPTEGDTMGEGWAIQAIDGNLVLCGAEQRGVIYALYHLLEDVLGVRWWNLWEQELPVGSALVPADYASSGVPAMEYREVFVGTEKSTDYPFYVFNRLNGNTTHIPAPYGGNKVYGGLSHVHNFNKYFTAEDFAAHPEWFSMDESGNRVGDRQLCLTNPELQAEFAKRLLSYVKKSPEGLFAVCPNDNKYLCDCPDCKAEIEAYNGSGYVLNFVNKMARAVTAAGYTKATIEMLVYWAYVEVPREIVPEPNVLLRIANNDIDILHGLEHPCNEDILERTKVWTELGSNDIYYWQYVVNYYNNGVVPSMFYYDDDFEILMEMGVNGWFAEQENAINTDFWDMKLWLLIKMMEEPVFGEEYEALMDEFIFGYYGEDAGQYIREYLYYMNDKAVAADVRQTFGTTIIGGEWLTVEDIIHGISVLDKAYEAAGNNELLRRRVRNARTGIDRVAYENYSRWEQEAEDAGLTLPFGKRELGERINYTFIEQIALRGDYDNGFSKYSSRYDCYTDELAALPEELAHLERDHVIEYFGADFNLSSGYSMVTDEASAVGQAASGDLNASMSSDGSFLIALYSPNGQIQNNVALIGQLFSDERIDDGQYHLYRFEFEVPVVGNSGYLYMFDSWGFKIPLMRDHMLDLAGQTVEIYLSVKTDSGKLFIDRVFMVTEESKAPHNYVRRQSDAMGVCQICGDVVESDDGRIVENAPVNNGKTDGGDKTVVIIVVIAVAYVVVLAVLAVLVVSFLKKKKNKQ